ncbi:MAG TPA: DUF4214 domain-containing protein, partial [Pyrinomonadaceae bacterium]|nr:DUF4214 domain-containing protein [Pyrinomonadaceae bacterium]
GGGEGLNAATVAIEGGLPFVYVTGNSQSSGINGCRLYVSKLNSAGTLLWTQTDAAATPCSQGLAITTLNGNVYIAGHNDDSGTQVYLVKYAAAGGPATWTRKSITFNGSYFGITAFGSAIYAFGYNQSGVGGSFDFLIEKWDEAGTLQWSKQYDRGSSEDVLYGGVGVGTRIYAVGSTTGGSAGGRDAVILELDPATGDLKSSTLFGGAQDDIAKGAATDGTSIFVVGESRSFASAAGNVIGQDDLMLLQFANTPTAAPAGISGTVTMADGAPISGATIHLDGTESRETITDANGKYGFDNVETNGFYTVTPSRVNYTFSPANRSFSLLGVHTEASFTASANGDHLNAIDTTEIFVRQQYLDFLGREPDPPGFNGWVNTINNCAAGDTSCDRVHVSEMFFRSAEFQERGYFVYRFYSTALGRKPDFAEFTPDMARVSGFLTNDQLEAAKTALANDFVTRPAFAQYATMTNAQYVDALAQTAGVTLSNRQALVNSLEAGKLTRAQALRQIAESNDVYAKYYNQAFVVMEYFGYLRRDPDILYRNWIGVLDANPADSRHMVEGFVDATEYRNRFKQ